MKKMKSGEKKKARIWDPPIHFQKQENKFFNILGFFSVHLFCKFFQAMAQGRWSARVSTGRLLNRNPKCSFPRPSCLKSRDKIRNQNSENTWSLPWERPWALGSVLGKLKCNPMKRSLISLFYLKHPDEGTGGGVEEKRKKQVSFWVLQSSHKKIN